MLLVDCSNCKTTLVLPPEAKSIRCSECQFITQIAESTQPPSPSGYSIFPGLEQSSSFNNLAPSSSGYPVFPGLQQSSSFNNHAPSPSGNTVFPGLQQSSSFNNHAPSPLPSGDSIFPGLQQSSSFDNHAPSPSGYSVFPGLQQSSSFNNQATSFYKQVAPVPTGYQVHTPTLTHSNSFHSNYVPPAGYGRKKAVIVGVSYKNTRHELKGCINDANYMKHLLLTKYNFPESEIVMLTEEEADPKRIPTGRNMRAALYWLISGCRQGDSLLFHFSGHGSRQKNYNGDEIDGYDETLCPLDFETDGMIVDDEINAIIVRPLPLGVKLHAIIDACHSGTVLDLPFLCRMSSAGHYEWEDHRPKSGIAKGTSGGEVISISGCDDDQTSADTSALSKITSTGAMTFCFIEAIEHGNASTYGSLLSSMRNAIRNASRGVGGGYGSRGFSQEPQLTSCEQFDMYSKRFEL